ncbi:unnamed protein product [Rhizopus stolonifer]
MFPATQESVTIQEPTKMADGWVDLDIDYGVDSPRESIESKEWIFWNLVKEDVTRAYIKSLKDELSPLGKNESLCVWTKILNKKNKKKPGFVPMTKTSLNKAYFIYQRLVKYAEHVVQERNQQKAIKCLVY